MSKQDLLTIAGAILLGLVYFGIVMGIAMGLVTLNARVSPNLVWFPLPALLILAGAIYWAQQRWDIGLSHPAGVDWPRIYVIGTALTILGVATAIVQGKFTGYVRATELIEAEVSPLFAVTYAFFMSVLAAVLAEATFRGVIQSRIEKVLSVWPTVILIGFINVIAHRWGPEITQNWLGLFVILAGWTYLRWLSGSLWPPLILHTLSNFFMALALWFNSPFEQGELAISTVAMIALVGLISLGIAVVQGRKLAAP
jgi:membrane protease YdiL (CAAX protease family)